MIEPCEEVKRVEQRYEKALDDMEKHYKDVLEQIRDEIEQEADYQDAYVNADVAKGMYWAAEIIDKHVGKENK